MSDGLKSIDQCLVEFGVQRPKSLENQLVAEKAKARSAEGDVEEVHAVLVEAMRIGLPRDRAGRLDQTVSRLLEIIHSAARQCESKLGHLAEFRPRDWQDGPPS